jgi:CBS domain-containing membrane protein
MTTFAYRHASRPMMLGSFTAADLMTPNPLAIEKGALIQRAYAFLQFNELDAAPVVDQHRRLVGIVSNASCATWEVFSLRSSPHGFSSEELDLTPVWDITSPIVENIRDDASMDEVIDRLAERRARRIYVVNDRHELVGVVSISDLIRHLSLRATGPFVSQMVATS